MIERFTKQEFEDALPTDKSTGETLWKPLGLIQGEYSYLLQIPDDYGVGIMIRSSIDASGVAADIGEDSLRAWLVSYEIEGSTITNIKSLGSKVSRWTTRIPGWRDRFIYNSDSVIKTLWIWRVRSGNCKVCGQPKKVFKVKKHGKNKGRVFAKCMEHNQFQWLT